MRHVECVNCGHSFGVPADMVAGNCPSCGEKFSVRSADEPDANAAQNLRREIVERCNRRAREAGLDVWQLLGVLDVAKDDLRKILRDGQEGGG